MESSALEAALHEANARFINNENAALDRVLRKLEHHTMAPPVRWQVLLLRGWLHYRRSQDGAAIRCADIVLVETGEPFYMGKAHLLRAISLENQATATSNADEMKLQAAMAECEQAIALLAGHTEQLWAYGGLATLLADWRDPDQGIALIEQALQGSWPQGRDLGWTYAHLGEIYALDKYDWRNGEQYLAKAAALLDPINKTHSWVHSLLAQCYNQLGEYDRAATHGQRALDLAAQDKSASEWVWVRAHNQYARALTWGNSDLRLAEKHFWKAMRLTAKNSELMAELYSGLGENLRQQARPDGALQAFRRALQIDEAAVESGGLYSSIADVAFKLKKYPDVIECVRLALDRPDLPSDWVVVDYYHLGVSLFKLREYAKATEAFRTGLSKTTSADPYWSALMKWLLAANRHVDGSSAAS